MLYAHYRRLVPVEEDCGWCSAPEGGYMIKASMQRNGLEVKNSLLQMLIQVKSSSSNRVL